ncbi:hypothetical protein O3M35_000018 [Rhynocoris fuscipes]|uniref:FAS1 domain-containing protein n=1 Tax=Rhynocoris fuscipes TaxID=488301 RepID=A0AAW1DS21_9HEMI
MQVAEGNMRHFLERSTAQLDNLINYHTLNKRLTSDEFEADMMVNTRFAGNKIRLNKFSSWINTVNCVSITNKDNEASNGIVHIIDSVLNPDSSPQRNVADILLQDGRFTRFTYAMENTGISRALRRSKDAVTILAPTDNAFQKLQSSTLQNLLNDDKAGEALIKNHILPHTLCLPAVIGQHKLKAESNEKLSFNCSTKGVSIGQNITLKEFMTADNGVVYVIDEVMFPTRANNLLKLLEDEKLNTFLKLMKFTKVDETFEQAGDYTLFVPNEESMLNMDATKLKELMENRVKARQFVLHHAVQGKFKNPRNLR